MSGYLSRLVARHVEAPSVRQRARSRYEQAGRVEEWSGGDRAAVVHDPITDRTIAAAAARDPEDPRGAPRSAQLEPARAAAQRGPAQSAALETPTRRPTPVPASDAEVGHGARAGRRPAEPTVGGPHPSDPEDAMRAGLIPRPTVRPGRVTPAWTNAPPVSARRRPDPAIGAWREPDVVQVHIGRVEVRAILPAAERVRPTALKPEAPRPLSLDRYLAGERRA